MQDCQKKAFKADTGNHQAFLGMLSVRTLIYVAISFFPRKLLVWFKRCCSPGWKDDIQNATVHLSPHTDRITPTPSLWLQDPGHAASTRNSQETGQLLAFATDPWYLLEFKQQ